ncbi:MAG: Xaa-Pro peptidase family protein [Pseudomonadota bacterium]
MSSLSPRHAFEKAEYERRLEKIRAEMAHRGIDVLCLTAPENIFYVTGYDGWSYYTHQMAVIHVNGSEPLWVGRGIDVPCADVTCWISNDSIIGYSDDYVDNDRQHAMEFIADQLKARGWGAAAIGFEYENYYFSARAFMTLQKTLPHATFHDVTNLVNWVRSVKSPVEIEYMRQAGLVADATMKAGVEAIAPGVRECDVAAVLNGAQTRGTEEFGGDAQSEVIVISTGEEVTCPHLVWTDRPLPSEGPINIELAGVRKRYTAALSRSIYIGTAPDAIRALGDATIDALETTLAAIKPGMLGEDVFHAYNGALEKYGEHKSSRVGYSIGIGYTPAWIERTISFRAGDKTELVPNMTFHIMCGMWRETDGFVQSETFRITETGCETFTNYPRGLIEIK